MTPKLHLPKLLNQVLETCGLDAALALASAFGGRDIKLPKRARVDHPIAMKAGLPVLERLVALHGGERIVIPMGPRHPDKVRAAYRASETARLQGESAAAIAGKLGMHERSVRLIRQKMAGRKQPDLFED